VACLRCGEEEFTMTYSPIRRVEGGRRAPGILSDVGWSAVSFPLCGKCFELASPNERLEYYRLRWLSTNPGPADLGEWFKIEELVLAGEDVGVPEGRGEVVGKDESTGRSRRDGS